MDFEEAKPARIPPEQAAGENSVEVLLAAAAFPQLTEDLAMALLQRRDLPEQVVEALSRNPGIRTKRTVTVALASHPQTPRRIALLLVRQLFSLELMQVALDAITPPDIRRVAEEVLIGRLPQISSGERMTLARRASGRVTGALLGDAEERIVKAALNNGRLVEADVVKALMQDTAQAHLVEAVCHHEKWSARREVRDALLRNHHTPLASALEFARGLRPHELSDLLAASRLPGSTKDYLLKELEGKGNRGQPTNL